MLPFGCKNVYAYIPVRVFMCGCMRASICAHLRMSLHIRAGNLLVYTSNICLGVQETDNIGFPSGGNGGGLGLNAFCILTHANQLLQ